MKTWGVTPSRGLGNGGSAGGCGSSWTTMDAEGEGAGTRGSAAARVLAKRAAIEQVQQKRGPGGYKGRVHKSWVRKKFVYGRNALQIAIFWYFIVFPPYPLPKNI
jgi:hypothetical protein